MADERAFAEELVAAFVRIARGDFAVRMPRTRRRDTEDTLAFFINLTAEELERLIGERDRIHKELEERVRELGEQFVALAAGNFEARARRSFRGDPMDVLAYLFNNTAVEVGDLVTGHERQRVVLEAILEAMLDGVLLLDAAGTIQRNNGAVAQLLGHEAAALAGRPFGGLLAASEAGFAASLAARVQAGPFRDRDTLFRTATGDVVSFSVNGSPYRDPAGALVGIVLVVRDDRPLKAALAQLQMSDRLSAMGAVAAGVAHEVNNPLSYVVSNLDFALEELEDASPLDEARLEELNRALASAQGGAERVRLLVQDLKMFSRVDTDSVRPLDLNKLVESSVSMIRNEVRHHARLVKAFGAVPIIEANEARLGQVILNLVQNAAHAIPAGRVDDNRITLTTGSDGDGNAFFEVRDTGCGIAPENLKRIFEAFYTTKPAGVGTGLGLAICQKVVTSLGGRIEVESEVDHGSLFRVVLPPARAHATASPVEPEAAARGPRGRVLVVDDEAEVGDSIRRILGREHDVEVVARGTAALLLLEKSAYDVVLSDLLMPDMTGMELYDRLSQSLPAVLPRIVFMTGGAFSPGARAFLERVPNPRIDKPIATAELRRLVRALTESPHG
jgi:PAS domain S-box-containing protein